MKTKMKFKPIILCGGSGTRLWPTSRENFPKQFIPLFQKKSLLELTIERILKIKKIEKPLFVTSKSYGFFVTQTLNKYGLEADIILEPESKNTTAAVYLAAKLSKPDDKLLIMPSDHLIIEEDEFIQNLNEIEKLTDFNEWITLGVKPSNPSEAYGYIHAISENGNKLLNVTKFVEKPNKKNATQMLKDNNFFWNAGIFIGKASMMINSISKHANQISKKCDEVFEKRLLKKNSNEINFEPKIFCDVISNSLDYAVMEKEKNIRLYPINCNWSDVGSWDEIAKQTNNASQSNIIQINSHNNFIKSDKRIIATIGIKDLIIIDSDNATLISKRDETQKVKEIVNNLVHNNSKEAKEHTYENRPWGRFDTLLNTDKCKVKKIEVLAKCRLSLQYHNYRSEHWLVIDGVATIYLNGEIFELNAGSSIDIPVKSKHYIENKTNDPLIIIETQLGTYFGEDDIIRIDDPYNR